MHKNKSLKVFLILIASITINCSYATTKLTKKTHELQNINSKIHILQKNLSTITSQQHKLQRNLKTIEVKIGGIAKKIKKNKIQLAKKKKQLRKLSQKHYDYKMQLQSQKQMLAQQVEAAYMLGRQPYLKIILNQENPEKITRYLHYYEQFNQARIKAIRKISYLSQQISITEKNYSQQTQALKKDQQIYKSHQNTFTTEKNQRQHLLKKISYDLHKTHSSLNKLQADKNRLEKIIKELNIEKLYGYVPGQQFSQMHHKLHWPIAGGHITQSFGQKIADGRMRSTGILLTAKAGTNIHAIFPGKVIFANWLHGFGLLVIIQHGQNYMSLYGRNQSLYVKKGDNIEPGQVIATVGDSGGFQNDGLYFEIRHNAQPVNPANWIRENK